MAGRSEDDPVDPLTPREREVLEFLRLGLTDREIGLRLSISRATASYHVSEIIGKLGVRNRYEAAAWPNRPPWWATALAPVLPGLRKVAGGLPVGASQIALALAAALFAAALGGLGLIAFLLIRGDGGPGATPREIVVPRSALETLQSYAFSSDIEVSSDEGSMRARYEGVFESPDRFQGTLTGEGELFDRYALPAETEVIFALSGQGWWREPGSTWQLADIWTLNPDPDESSGWRTNPLLLLNGLGTPWFYLHAYNFDSLRLTTDGSIKTIHGVSAYRVRLDKAAVADLVSQATSVGGFMDVPEIALSEEDIADIQQNALENMPDDMVIETWIAEAGGYPVHTVITFTVSDSGEGLLVGEFPPSSKVRLQMDITDPDIVVNIEVPTEISTPEIPPAQ